MHRRAGDGGGAMRPPVILSAASLQSSAAFERSHASLDVVTMNMRRKPTILKAGH